MPRVRATGSPPWVPRHATPAALPAGVSPGRRAGRVVGRDAGRVVGRDAGRVVGRDAGLVVGPCVGPAAADRHLPAAGSHGRPADQAGDRGLAAEPSPPRPGAHSAVARGPPANLERGVRAAALPRSRRPRPEPRHDAAPARTACRADASWVGRQWRAPQVDPSSVRAGRPGRSGEHPWSPGGSPQRAGRRPCLWTLTATSPRPRAPPSRACGSMTRGPGPRWACPRLASSPAAWVSPVARRQSPVASAVRRQRCPSRVSSTVIPRSAS